MLNRIEIFINVNGQLKPITDFSKEQLLKVKEWYIKENARLTIKSIPQLKSD